MVAEHALSNREAILLDEPDAFAHSATRHADRYTAILAGRTVGAKTWVVETHGVITEGAKKFEISAAECAEGIAIVRSLRPA